MKKVLDTLAVILLCMSSMTVTIVGIVYLVSQQPYAHKSDIAEVKQTAVTALQNTHFEQAVQDKSSAEVKADLEKANAQIKLDHAEIATLKKHLAELRKGQTVEQEQLYRLQ